MDDKLLIYSNIEIEGLKIDLLINQFINENHNIKKSLGFEIINEAIDIKTIKDKIIKILDTIWDKIKSVEDIMDEIKDNRDLAKFVLSEYKIPDSVIDKKDENADLSKLTKIINTNDIVKSLYGERNITITNKNILKYKPMIEESIKTRGSAIVTIHKGYKSTKAVIENYKTTANTLDKLFKETNKDLTTKYCTCCATSINYVKNVSYLSINVITKIIGSYDPIIKKIIKMDNDKEISNKASQYIENF